MIRLFEIALPPYHSEPDIPKAVARVLAIPLTAILTIQVRRRAIDARRRGEVRLVYTVDIETANEKQILQRKGRIQIATVEDTPYLLPVAGAAPLQNRPVVIGAGPAGLFAALTLARAGFRPLLVERGKAVQERARDVERFWREGTLDPHSNAQFGEGGAGAFSDGKLTTSITDPRCREVLKILVESGAPPEILTAAKPHVGTDRLRPVVAALRQAIIDLGGEVSFSSQVTGMKIGNGVLQALQVNEREYIHCQAAILAIGHSARDTFNSLLSCGIALQQKPFAIGVRIEHLQAAVDLTQFGAFAGMQQLGAADYKCAWHGPDGRSVYSFCMCPGGEVIAASSQVGALVTNGMSYMSRAQTNANAALLVNVLPSDFGSDHPLAGFAFQQQWEQKAFAMGGGNYCAPAQQVEDFLAARAGTGFATVQPTYRPGVAPALLDSCLPTFVAAALRQGIPALARQLPFFGDRAAVLTGVETRSSCPVRMVRGASGESVTVSGLYPAGEGAGYAGGIMSAAVDGMRAAEAVISRFAPHAGHS